MKHVLIVHEVEDYAAWKAVFDGASGIRKEAGVKAPQFVYLNEVEAGTL